MTDHSQRNLELERLKRIEQQNASKLEQKTDEFNIQIWNVKKVSFCAGIY